MVVTRGDFHGTISERVETRSRALRCVLGNFQVEEGNTSKCYCLLSVQCQRSECIPESASSFHQSSVQRASVYLKVLIASISPVLKE